MITSESQTGPNFSKAEWISLAIVSLTLFYVIGTFFYNPSKASYTETFKIVSKEFIPKSETRHNSYGRSGRHGVFRPFTTFLPDHYRVYIQWRDDTYPIYVPREKGYLLNNDKITFTYRITDDGWPRLLEFHDINAQVETIEIIDFGVFESKTVTGY